MHFNSGFLMACTALQSCLLSDNLHCKKSFFLKETFEMFGRIACKLPEILNKMGLIEEIIFITNFCQRL